MPTATRGKSSGTQAGRGGQAGRNRAAHAPREQRETPDWATMRAVLERALTEPGILSAAYKRFYTYSFGNQILIMVQQMLNTSEGPVGTYRKWQALKRQVRKGEKAMMIWVPIPFTKRDAATGEEERRVFFDLKFSLFSFSQTDPMEGYEEQPEPDVPEWDRTLAMASLGMIEEPFRMANGNCQGYCSPKTKTLAINPLAENPTKTRFHELGHALLHGGDEEFVDGQDLERSLKEGEAEAVALLCISALGLPGEEASRGYIRHWLGSQDITDQMARRVIGACTKILAAGRAVPAESKDEADQAA